MSRVENRRNYYRILHVQPDAPREIIRSTYRTMMHKLRMHPDLGGDDWNATLLNEAYETLSDPKKRANYDREQLSQMREGVTTDAMDSVAASVSEFKQQCIFCQFPHQYNADAPVGALCNNCQSPLSMAPQSQVEDSCRRAIMRTPKDHPLAFHLNWPQSEPCSGRTDNLSLNGMRFHSDKALELGQIIKIDCEILRAVGRVTHSQQRMDLDEQWTTGVQFVSLSFEQSRGTFVSAQA
ncbi:MAG: DnaJ domain-containing protein [Halieaceae bacterium]|jgi:hypothetical protein|nr:DnaJ domain-containing protein [Halieaceae bacterium]